MTEVVLLVQLPTNLQTLASKHPMRGSRRQVLIASFCLVLSLAEFGATCPPGLCGVRLLQRPFGAPKYQQVIFQEYERVL